MLRNCGCVVYEEMEDKASEMYDEYDNVTIPPLEERCEVLEAGFEEFATVLWYSTKQSASHVSHAICHCHSFPP